MEGEGERKVKEREMEAVEGDLGFAPPKNFGTAPLCWSF